MSQDSHERVNYKEAAAVLLLPVVGMLAEQFTPLPGLGFLNGCLAGTVLLICIKLRDFVNIPRTPALLRSLAIVTMVVGVMLPWQINCTSEYRLRSARGTHGGSLRPCDYTFSSVLPIWNAREFSSNPGVHVLQPLVYPLPMLVLGLFWAFGRSKGKDNN